MRSLSYLFDATIKASGPNGRQARFALASCRSAQQMVAYRGYVSGTTGYFCRRKRVISALESLPDFCLLSMRLKCLLWPWSNLLSRRSRRNATNFSWEKKKIASRERWGLQVKICVIFLHAEVSKTAVALPLAHCFSLCPLLIWLADWWMHCPVLSNLAFFFPAAGIPFSVYICTLHNLSLLIITHHWHLNKQDLLN